MMKLEHFMKQKLHTKCNKLSTSLSILLILFFCGRSQASTLTDSDNCCFVEENVLALFQHIRDNSHKFLILIGASKSGSTFLFNLMASHPDTSSPISRNGRPDRSYSKYGMNLKEMHFFDLRGEKFENYVKSFNLSDLEHGKTLIEGTPSYILHTKSACLIKQYLPNAKFIVIFKEPAQRALSHYKMGGRLYGFNNVSISQISDFKKLQCDLMNKGWTDCFGCSDAQRNLITRGFYGPQLKNWLQFFKPEQFLIINHNETDDLQKTADKIFKFANLKPYQVEGDGITGFMGKSMPFIQEIHKTLDLLQDFFKPYNEFLYEVLRNDFKVYDFKFE